MGRSPWLSADSASPDLRHNERAQSLPVDTPKAWIKEAELKKYRDLHPGSELDRICEKQDNKAREKFGFAPKPPTKLFSKFEYENLIEERKEFLKSMNIQLEPDDYCKFTTKSGFIALGMIEEKQKLVKDIDFVGVATLNELVNKLMSEFDENEKCRTCNEIHADMKQQRTPRRGDVAVTGTHYSGAVGPCQSCGMVECDAMDANSCLARNTPLPDCSSSRSSSPVIRRTKSQVFTTSTFKPMRATDNSGDIEKLKKKIKTMKGLAEMEDDAHFKEELLQRVDDLILNLATLCGNGQGGHDAKSSGKKQDDGQRGQRDRGGQRDREQQRGQQTPGGQRPPGGDGGHDNDGSGRKPDQQAPPRDQGGTGARGRGSS